MIIRGYPNDRIYEMDIIKTDDGFYRFINHKESLLSTGFRAESNLIKYKNCIRFDKDTINIMIKRYFIHK